MSPMLERMSPLAAVLTESLGGRSPKLTGQQCVVALYDYEPVEEDELKVAEDERLTLVDDTDESWWLVQRLHGSKRQGLVPSAYLQKVDPLAGKERSPLEEDFEGPAVRARPPAPREEDEERAGERVKSPTSPLSRPRTPMTSPSYLDELKAKHRSRDPLPAPEEPVVLVVPVVSVEPMEPVEPLRSEAEDRAAEPEAVPASSADAAENNAHASPPTTHVATEKAPASAPAPTPTPTPKPTPTPTREEPEAPRQAPSPGLKVVSPKISKKMDEMHSPLAQMLLRRQQDAGRGEVRPPEPERAEPEAIVVKPNPWKNLSMKNIAGAKEDRTGRTGAPVAAKSLPSRPTQAGSGDKPKASETRLWTSRNGQYQVEAKYLGYQDSKVQLHKLNGNRIAVALDQLCDRDKEYVYRREGLPWDQGPQRDFAVLGFDWFAFFLEAGLDTAAARQRAQRCVDHRVPGQAVFSGALTRDVLMGLGLPEGEVLSVLRHAQVLRKRREDEEAVQRSLAQIQLVRTTMPPRAPVAVAPPPREADAFAAILQPTPVAPPKPTVEASRGLAAIPSLHPEPTNRPVVLTSTMVQTFPGGVGYPPQEAPRPPQGYQPGQQAPFYRPSAPGPVHAPHAYHHPGQSAGGPPNPLQNTSGADPRRAQMHTLHSVSHGYALPHGYAQQPHPGYVQQPQPGYAQPPHPGYAQQSHPGCTQQPHPSYAQQPYPMVLGTTVQRTEYYGQRPGQTPQPMAPLQQPIGIGPPPAPQSSPHIIMQASPAMQRAPPRPALQGASEGDKYSIFKYVDPATPQVLGQPPAHQGLGPNQPSGFYHPS